MTEGDRLLQRALHMRMYGPSAMEDSWLDWECDAEAYLAAKRGSDG